MSWSSSSSLPLLSLSLPSFCLPLRQTCRVCLRPADQTKARTEHLRCCHWQWVVGSGGGGGYSGSERIKLVRRRKWQTANDVDQFQGQRTPTLWRWNRFDSCKCKCRPRGKHNAFGNKTHAPEQRTGSRRCQWPGRLNIIYAMKIRAIQMAIFHFIYITIFLYLFVSLSFLPPLTNLTPWLWMVSRCHAP